MKKSVGAGTLAVPSPVWVVGTYDDHGKPNMMTAAWGGICCSRPPCIYVSLREATYSHGNIMNREAYTVSIPGEEYWREADYTGIASGRDTDKFKETGLTPVKSEVVDASYIEEYPESLSSVFSSTHSRFLERRRYQLLKSSMMKFSKARAALWISKSLKYL